MQEEYIALVGIVMTMMIPIVAILTHHQRKMTELLHKTRGSNDATVDRLEQEMRELKQLLHAQTIALDNLGLARAKPDFAEVPNRLQG